MKGTFAMKIGDETDTGSGEYMSRVATANETRFAGASAPADAGEEREMKESHARGAERSTEPAAQAPSPWRLHSGRRRSGGRFSEGAGACPWRVQEPRQRREARSERPAPDRKRALEEAMS